MTRPTSAATCLFVGSAGGEQRGALIAALQGLGCAVEHHDDFANARERAAESAFDLAVFDLRDGEIDLATLGADWMPASAVAVTCSPEERSEAVDALHAGAANYLCEPYDVEQAAAMLRSSAHAWFYRTEVARLTSMRFDSPPDEFVVDKSPVVRRLKSAIRRASDIDATVLIEGAAGTGKTLVAREIHFRGHRAQGPWITLYSKNLTDELLVQALADAQHGTLLLEHIEEMPTRVQAKLVQKLKERASGCEASEARLIATTAGRLAELTARGTFREDLYYRLNAFPMQLPLLKERTEDITFLADLFLEQAAQMSGKQHKGFTPPALILLETNPWPGNVAQLRNVVFRAHLAAGNKQIDRVHLIGPVMGVQAPPEVSALRGPSDEPEQISEADVIPFQEEERRILTRALKAAKGNVRKAAEMLGIGRATLYRKIQVFELSLS